MFFNNFYVRLCFFVFTIVFCLEYYGGKREWTNKPSDILTRAQGVLQRFWTRVGKCFAWISGFIDIIDFHEVFVTFKRLVSPILGMILSVGYLVVGYISQMNLYDHPYLVACGSTIIVGLTSYLFLYNPFLNNLIRRFI